MIDRKLMNFSWHLSILVFMIIITLVGVSDFVFQKPISIFVYYALTLFILCLGALAYVGRVRHRHQRLKQKIQARTAELTEALRVAELANRTKTMFLANMSHEFRTPLNAILGFSSAMQQEMFGPLNNETYKQYVDYIQKSGLHLLNLINDILDLSKIEANKTAIKKTWLNIYTLLTDVLQIIAGYTSASDREITVNCEENLPHLWADARMVRQMLLNLLSNAIKFTEKGGKIQIRVYISLEHEYVICVKDNGIGIPKDKLQEIRDPFAQVEDGLIKTHRGTGLGLSLVDKLITLHGGRLEIESKLHKGTACYLFFPAPQKRGKKK